MSKYQHPTENRVFYAPDREASVDSSVSLWHIAGLSNYSVPRPLWSRAPAGQMADVSGSGPGGAYMAWDMRAAYYGGSSLTGSGQCVGLAEFDGYDISDVTSTFNGAATTTNNGSNYTLTYTPPTGGGPYTVAINNVLVDGGTVTPNPNDTGAETEVVLDIAQVIGMAPGISQVRLYLAPDSFSTAFPDYQFPSNSADTDIFNDMVADSGACKQLSISWGWTPESITANDPIFENMAADGQSFFAASGDSGAWINDAFRYPAEDADLTAVGGTDLTTNGADGSWASETGWSNSGGGVSPDDVPLPSYQSGYTCSGCSTSYRNAPDVAMEADNDNYVCGFGSCIQDGGGTSFAAPRWAAFVALANQEAASNGQGQGIGLINYLEYSLTPGSYDANFHDIITGSNGSYSASYGYDLVTGMGSPNGAMSVNTLAMGRSAGGWVTLNGPQSYPDCMAYTPTTITVGGYQVSESYSSNETVDQLTANLSAGLNASNSPVVSLNGGNTVYIAAKNPGTSGNGMSLSGTGTECLYRTQYYPVFTVSTSGPLSGGGGR